MFDIHGSTLCTVYLENLGSEVNKRRYLPNLPSGLTISRTAIYVPSINDTGAPLDNCIGFIVCTKVQICRPGGSGSSQKKKKRATQDEKNSLLDISDNIYAG